MVPAQRWFFGKVRSMMPPHRWQTGAYRFHAATVRFRHCIELYGLFATG